MDNQKAKGLNTEEFRKRRYAELLDPVRSFQRAVSNALHPNYFQGFDPDDEAAHNRVARQRARNKAARRSRRINRKVAQRR